MSWSNSVMQRFLDQCSSAFVEIYWIVLHCLTWRLYVCLAVKRNCDCAINQSKLSWIVRKRCSKNKARDSRGRNGQLATERAVWNAWKRWKIKVNMSREKSCFWRSKMEKCNKLNTVQERENECYANDCHLHVNYM